MHTYKVTVYTGDDDEAGTDASVHITLFGEKGDSGAKKINHRKRDDFERNQADVFNIDCPFLGKLLKIKIGHNNARSGKGQNPDWLLNKVVVEDLKQKQIYEFQCGSWLGKDGSPLSQELFPKPLTTKYKVTVYTGDEVGAGTDASVYIILFGENGDSGKTKINHRRRNDFERNQIDEFEVETPSLGKLHKIAIGHNNFTARNKQDPDWLLEKVVVSDTELNQDYLFLCGKWLGKDDSPICQELFPTQQDCGHKKPTPPISAVIELQSWGYEDNTDQQNGYIKVNGDTYFTSVMEPFERRFRGVTLMILDPTTLTMSSIKSHDVNINPSDDLASDIANLPKGAVLIGVTADEPIQNLKAALGPLQSIGVSVGDVGYRGKFAFVAIVGFPNTVKQVKASRGGSAVQLNVTLQISPSGIQII